MKVKALKKILETIDDDFEVLTYDPDEWETYKAEVNVYKEERAISFDHYYHSATKVYSLKGDAENYNEDYGEIL